MQLRVVRVEYLVGDGQSVASIPHHLILVGPDVVVSVAE